MARLKEGSSIYGSSASLVSKDLEMLSGRPLIKKMTRSGHNNFMVLYEDGRIYSAAGEGSNSASGHGRGNNNEDPIRGLDMLAPVHVPTTASDPVVDIGGNGYAGMWALTRSGDLYMWGYNGYGQCGLGHTTMVPHPTFVIDGVTEVFDQNGDGYDVARSSMAVKRTDGYCYFWGENQDGELGFGNTSTYYTPTKSTTLGLNVVKILNMGGYAGWMLAQKSDNSIWFTGWNGSGHAGKGNTTGVQVWTDVSSYWGTCAQGQIKSWDAANSYYDSSVKNYHSLHIINHLGKYWRAGDGRYGQLLNGTSGLTTAAECTDATISPKVLDSVQVYGGGPCTVALMDYTSWGAYANTYLFGYSSYGQVPGVTGNATSPVLIKVDAEGKQRNRIRNGYYHYGFFSGGQNSHTYSYRSHTYYVDDTTKRLMACGYNNSCYLGVGRAYTADAQPTALEVRLPAEAGTVIDMGFFTTTSHGRISVAYTNQNRMFAWGYNDHQGIHYPNLGRVYTPIEIRLPQ